MVAAAKQTFKTEKTLHETYLLYTRQLRQGICSSHPSSSSKRLDFPDPYLFHHLQLLNIFPAGPVERKHQFYASECKTGVTKFHRCWCWTLEKQEITKRRPRCPTKNERQDANQEHSGFWKSCPTSSWPLGSNIYLQQWMSSQELKGKLWSISFIFWQVSNKVQPCQASRVSPTVSGLVFELLAPHPCQHCPTTD